MTKVERLEQMLATLEAGKFTDSQRKTLVFSLSNGTHVRLNDPRAAELLRQRIAEERAAEAP